MVFAALKNTYLVSPDNFHWRPADGPPNSAPLVAAAHLVTADADITHQAKAALWPRGSAACWGFWGG